MKTYQDSSPAFAGPWTAAEAALLTAAAAQTRELSAGALEALHQAYAPSALDGRTRGDQLRYEALDREVLRRTELLQLVLQVLPTYQFDTGSFMPMREQGAARAARMDRRSSRRLQGLDLPALELELLRVLEVAEYGATRETRTRLYHYSTDLRRRIESLKQAAHSRGTALIPLPPSPSSRQPSHDSLGDQR